MGKKFSNYAEIAKIIEEQNRPLRSDKEIEKEISKAIFKIQREYEKILFLTIERDVGVKITPLRNGGAVIDGEVLDEEKFNDWLDEIVEEYELDKEESERTHHGYDA